jgi:hypothetical protein
MEVFVEFQASCQRSQSADVILSLFRNLSKNQSENRIASTFAEYNLNSGEINSLEKLVEDHIENLG